MGFFSRNESSTTGRRGTSGSSDAQLTELRGRARRRLIGALVLVLAVIVIVPLLIDNGGDPEPEPTLALTPPPVVTPGSASQQPGAGLVVEQVIQPEPSLSQPEGAATPSNPDAQADHGTVQQPEPALEPEPQPAPEPKPAPVQPKPELKPATPKPEPKPAQPKPAPDRTDDGSVAIAMLEGRIPAGSTAKPAASTPQSGSFIIQAAAYSSEKDAQSRREQLRAAGVTNAYVETANASGRSTYRLRVGPFSSREAAVAGQTRLRSLGYQDSFITAQ